MQADEEESEDEHDHDDNDEVEGNEDVDFIPEASAEEPVGDD